VFKNSTGYNESIEIPTTSLAPFVGTKESALRYVCNSLDSDSRIALLTSSTFNIFGGHNATLHKINGISRVVLVIQIDGSN